MLYKNTSIIAKTFYGVTFKPGETKEVSQYINDPKMIKVKERPKKPTSGSVPQPKSAADKSTNTKSHETKQGGKTDGTDSNQ